MFVQQLYTNCLAEAAYYIESDGEAAIVDPIREVGHYLELAQSRGAKIKYVFETHFHADFVSGHIDLAKQSGSTIVFGPMAKTAYTVYNATDGEEFKIGKIRIRAIHTPGHTPESTCYLLLDESGREYCIFTGDTLFVGDVGRPDLLDGKMTSESLAGMMYDSLNNKIKKLPDDVIVYPAHGPGSSCGKNLGKETWSTIGHQKKTNYALKEIGRNEFIRELTEGLSAPPAYFFEDARINQQGYDSVELVMKKNLVPLSVKQVEQELSNGALVLDTRNPEDFESGFIPGAINIGLKGMYAIWVGTLIDIARPLVIVSDPGKEEESIMRLARVGYENVKGYLAGGMASWISASGKTDKIVTVTAKAFADKVKHNVSVLDVRKFSETELGHIPSAKIIPLADLSKNLDSLDQNEDLYIYCASGNRSVIAASILKTKGFNRVINVAGGWNKIKETDVTQSVALPAGNEKLS